MADERWFTQLESRLFTLVSYRVKKALADKYTKIKFTTDDQSNGTPIFPTWYFHELQPVETGQGLENSTINAVIETIEVIVHAKSKDSAKEIMAETVYQMKQLRFNVTMMPIVTSDSNIYSSVARFRRLIGAGDTDIVN